MYRTNQNHTLTYSHTQTNMDSPEIGRSQKFRWRGIMCVHMNQPWALPVVSLLGLSLVITWARRVWWRPVEHGTLEGIEVLTRKNLRRGYVCVVFVCMVWLRTCVCWVVCVWCVCVWSVVCAGCMSVWVWYATNLIPHIIDFPSGYVNSKQVSIFYVVINLFMHGIQHRQRDVLLINRNYKQTNEKEREMGMCEMQYINYISYITYVKKMCTYAFQ